MDENTQNEILNHCRIQQFLNKATEKLHQIFRNRWSIYKKLKGESHESEWKDTEEYGAMLLSLCTAVFPKIADVLKTGKVDLWDITLTNIAIQSVSKAIRNHRVVTDVNEDRLINDLRELRNEIAHRHCKIPDDEFNIYSDQLTDILIRSGNNPSEVETFKKDLMKFGEPKIVEIQPEKPKFEKLKEKANKLFKDNNYEEAIKVYTELLNISGTTPENQAVIYSNRSVAYFLLKTKTYLLMAKRDADWAVQLRPCWWRGYFRLGRAQIGLKEWHDAEDSLNKALVLNRGSKEVFQELSIVRNQIGILSRKDHLNPDLQPKSEEEQIEDLCSRMGISKDQAKKIHELAMKSPHGNILKGHQFRDGNGVPQDYEMALKYYAKAATHGIPEGMYNLGQLYHHGRGVERDFKESLYWYKKAANSEPPPVIAGSGVPEAQHMLGIIYSEGIGVNQDYKQAAEWYEKAIINGMGGSANNLGIQYQNGQGVEKSAVKAFQYFKLAAQRGDTPGMQNLAKCYFKGEGIGSLMPTKADIAEGKRWLRIAAEKGDGWAARELEELENATLNDFQDIAVAKQIFPGIVKRTTNPLDQEQYGKYIKEAAKKGSITAKRHIEIWKNMNAAIEAFKKNDSAEVCACLSKAIRLDHQIVEIPELLIPVVVERLKNHPNDLDAITCFVRLNTKNDRLTEYMEEYLKIFPDDKFFLEMQIICYVCDEKWHKAFNLIAKALKLYPNSLRFLYARATTLAQQKPKENHQSPEVLKALNKFLAIAPPDHDKVPACLYRKARYYFLLGNKEKCFEFYEAGLESEKKQLPCFLPYDFPDKKLLEFVYSHRETTEKVVKDGLPSAPNSSTQNIPQKLSNPKRKILFIQNRETIAKLEENSKMKFKIANTIAQPPNTPSRQFSNDLKPITLKDMDPTKDKVYNGFILKVRIIDWPFVMVGIATIMEDENGDTERIAIYKWPMSMELMRTFRSNTILSIVNPYMRQAQDGKSIIRVEGPEFIKIDHSLADKQCHTCGKEAKIMPCSQCLMARYCSKECQKLDWNEFNHKKVCKYIKEYSNAVYS